MHDGFSKSDRTRIRLLGGLAWERLLRAELMDIRTSIDAMDGEKLSPFDVNDLIHKFHEGASQELFSSFSHSLPWLAVCRAHLDGVLTDDDLTEASDKIRDGLNKFAADYATLHGVENSSNATNAG